MSKKEAKGLKTLTDIKKAIVKELDEIKDAVDFIQVSV